MKEFFSKICKPFYLVKEFHRNTSSTFHACQKKFCGEWISWEKASLGVSKELFLRRRKSVSREPNEKNAHSTNYPRAYRCVGAEKFRIVGSKNRFFHQKSFALHRYMCKGGTCIGEIFGGNFLLYHRNSQTQIQAEKNSWMESLMFYMKSYSVLSYLGSAKKKVLCDERGSNVIYVFKELRCISRHFDFSQQLTTNVDF